MFGVGIGAADMPREHRNDELRGIVHHQHAGVFVLGLEMRRNQPHHRAERDEEHDLVVGREQAADLRAERARVRPDIVR